MSETAKRIRPQHGFQINGNPSGKINTERGNHYFIECLKGNIFGALMARKAGQAAKDNV